MKAHWRSGGKDRHDKRFALSWRQALAGMVLWLSAAPGLTDYVDAWGPALGSHLPPLQATDETGAERTLTDLYGDQGLLLFLNRSADW